MRRRDSAISPVERSHDAHEVDSLHRGLEIMRSFRPGESTLSCSEIALRMGLRRTTTQRLLDTLVAHQLLRQIPGTERYQPDLASLVLGHAYLTSAMIVRLARPAMQSLSAQLGVCVVLTMRERLHMLCLDLCGQRNPAIPYQMMSVGASLPMTLTAAGRAWLWAQSGAAQGEVIQRAKAEGGEEGARSIPGVYRAFQEMEERGYCINAGEWLRDVTSIATAVTLQQGMTYALSCEMGGMGVQSRLSVDEVGTALLETASQIRDAARRIGQ
jgi:DNA-binding IclR family transcriptional regulator